MLTKAERECVMLATQLATAREALQKIVDLNIRESKEDPANLLQEAQRIADEGLREAGLKPQ